MYLVLGTKSLELSELLALRRRIVVALEFVVYAGAVGFVSGQQRGGGYMGRMLGVDLDIGHRGHHGGEHHIPALGGIGVDAHFYAPEHGDLRGELQQGVAEGFGHAAALLRGASKLECDNMLYHCRKVLKV